MAAQAKKETAKAEEDKKAAEDNMVVLTEHIRKLEADLASAKESYAGVKALILNHAITQGAVEENEKKACEELEKEKTHSHSLCDDVERLKKVIQEKEEAILLLGKLIEDLWFKKTEVVRSFKKIEKDNTDLVGENTTLYEHVCGKCLFFMLVLLTYLFFGDSLSRWFLQSLRTICLERIPPPRLSRLHSRGRLR